MRRTLYRVCVSGVILSVGHLLLKHVVAARLIGSIRRPVDLSPAQLGLPCREISLRTDDGLTLKAWWVDTEEEPTRAAILVHGWGGDKSERHLIETARIYFEADFNVLLLGLRSHGNSEGKRITGGYEELHDVRAALRWLKEQGFEPKELVLHGWSMGGATVMRAAPEAGVTAVVEEAGYADLTSVFSERLAQAIGLPPFPNFAIALASKLWLGMDSRIVRPEQEARKLSERGVPLLVIHSRSDEVVPFEHAQRFVRAHPGATFWEIEGYKHVGAYMHPEYEQRLVAFLCKALAKPCS